MELETLMGGTQVEEDHKFYKEEDGNHLGLAWIIIDFVCLDYLASSCCLAEL